MKSNKAETPADIPRLFVQAWNERDAQSLANCFSKDAEFVNVVGLWWHNRDDIFKAHDYGLRVIFKDSILELRRVKEKALSDNVVVVHAKMKLSGQTATNAVNTPGNRFNLFTFVTQKFDQEWLCVSAHNTDIVSGVETNIVDHEGKLKGIDYRNTES